MNNNTVSNPKMEVPETKEMNDCDYLRDLLNNEKCLSDVLSMALSEASNETLYKEIMPLFNDVKRNGRDIFNLMFKNGWYPLEKAEETKIQQKKSEFSTKMSQLE